MIRIFVPRVPEFEPLVASARSSGHCRIDDGGDIYTVISADEPVTFNRRAMRLKPAVWYGIFTGGLQGVIEHFGRDEVRVVDDEGSTEPSGRASA